MRERRRVVDGLPLEEHFVKFVRSVWVGRRLKTYVIKAGLDIDRGSDR